MKFNDNGMRLYTILTFITMMFIAMDSEDMTIFILTKIVAILLMYILSKLVKYIPE